MSRYRTAGNKTASNADLETRPILFKGKSPRDRPSARNVQFRLPGKTDVINMASVQSQKNSTAGPRQNFFESKELLLQNYDPTRPDESRSAAISRKISPRDLVMRRDKHSPRKIFEQNDN